MTTKQHESAADTGKYLSELSDRAMALMQDLEYLNDEFELTPIRHQTLEELTEQLHNIALTIHGIAK